MGLLADCMVCGVLADTLVWIFPLFFLSLFGDAVCGFGANTPTKAVCPGFSEFTYPSREVSFPPLANFRLLKSPCSTTHVSPVFWSLVGVIAFGGVGVSSWEKMQAGTRHLAPSGQGNFPNSLLVDHIFLVGRNSLIAAFYKLKGRSHRVLTTCGWLW